MLTKVLSNNLKVIFLTIFISHKTNIFTTGKDYFFKKAVRLEKSADFLFADEPLNEKAMEKYDEAILLYNTIEKFENATIVSIKVAQSFKLEAQKTQDLPTTTKDIETVAFYYKKSGWYFGKAKMFKNARSAYSTAIELLKTYDPLDKNKKFQNLISEIEQLKTLVHPKKRKRSFSYDQVEICIICQDCISETERTFESKCNHKFHDNCWEQFVEKKIESGLLKIHCPLCNTLSISLEPTPCLEKKQTLAQAQREAERQIEDENIAMQIQQQLYEEEEEE